MNVVNHRFTVEEYHKMADAGILGADDRVELIDGEVVEVAPIGSNHVRAVNALTDILADFRASGRAPERYTISVQNPVVLSINQEPQPDTALLRAGRNRAELPQAADALLVVEVADTPITYDRERKLPLYAEAGIPEAWLIDLTEDRVEVHSSPESGGAGYGKVSRFVRGEKVVSAAFSYLVFDAAEALPPEGS